MKNFPIFSMDDVLMLLNIFHLQKNRNSYIPIP